LAQLESQESAGSDLSGNFQVATILNSSVVTNSESRHLNRRIQGVGKVVMRA
jgi:hypothetical protein